MELVKAENLNFTYPKQPKDSGKQEKVLKDLSFSIREGEFLVICGASGCGKTTLLKLLKRELTPAGDKSGKIFFRGKLQEELTDREAACEIGYVLQNPESQTVTDKVWHELAFGLENMGIPTEIIRRRVAEMACFFGIDDWFRKDTADLSGGQKQLLNLASVMAMQPRLLILDEPTSQLDPIAAADFINTLVKINKDLGMTIVLTEHRLEEVFPVADRVMIMDKGEILYLGAPEKAGRSLRALAPEHPMLLGFPSAVRIFQSVGDEAEICPLTVRDGRNYLTDNFLSRENALNKPVKDHSGRPIAMRAKNLTFRYEKNSPDVLDRAGFLIREGEFVSILGGNGSGKTTLLRVLSGALKPQHGKLEILGKPASAYKGRDLYVRNLASLPQNPQTVFIRMTVREDYEEMRKVMGFSPEEMEEKIREISERLEIRHLLDRHPYDLSGGEQQKAAIGKVLLQEPRILLLDEPTKGIDAGAKKQIGTMLRGLADQGMTILTVTHDVEFAAEHSDRCGLFFDHAITSVDEPVSFFCNNNYYTTAANRISRHMYLDAVTVGDVAELCRRNGRRTAHESSL